MTLSSPISLGRATYPVIYAVAAVIVSLCVMPLFRKKLNVKGKVGAARLQKTATCTLLSSNWVIRSPATSPPINHTHTNVVSVSPLLIRDLYWAA